MVLLKTVTVEADRFSRRAQYGVALDKRVYVIMWLTYSRYFNNMVRSTLISDYPIMPDDIPTNNKIYGISLHYLKG